MSNRHALDERTDRLVRRQTGWADRSTLAWAGTRLSVALRDVERSLFSRFGPNVKPDWDSALRPFYLLGLAYAALIGGILLLHAFGSRPT